jgi:hypothetical protein
MSASYLNTAVATGDHLACICAETSEISREIVTEGVPQQDKQQQNPKNATTAALNHNRPHLANTTARDEFKTDFLSWSQLEQHGGVPGEKVNKTAAWLILCGL